MSTEQHAVEEVDAEVVAPGTDIEPTAPTPAEVSIAPQATAAELGQRLEVIKQAMENEMEEGTDYGKVPGTDKPTLYKSGAEKLSVLFQLDVQPRSTKTWQGDHLTVETFATVFSMTTGARMGGGEGLCTTRERKYGKRKAKRVCPKCKEESIIRSKFDDGWYCLPAADGCGAKFEGSDVEIVGQDVGDIENPDLPDTWNTVIKMAEKRARVNAVLAVTGASAIFTQDLEEEAEEKAAAAGLPKASAEQRKALNAALNWLLPDAEGEAAWGTIKGLFGGELYGPVCEAVTSTIEVRKSLEQPEAQ